MEKADATTAPTPIVTAQEAVRGFFVSNFRSASEEMMMSLHDDEQDHSEHQEELDEQQHHHTPERHPDEQEAPSTPRPTSRHLAQFRVVDIPPFRGNSSSSAPSFSFFNFEDTNDDNNDFSFSLGSRQNALRFEEWDDLTYLMDV